MSKNNGQASRIFDRLARAQTMGRNGSSQPTALIFAFSGWKNAGAARPYSYSAKNLLNFTI